MNSGSDGNGEEFFDAVDEHRGVADEPRPMPVPVRPPPPRPTLPTPPGPGPTIEEHTAKLSVEERARSNTSSPEASELSVHSFGRFGVVSLSWPPL